MGLSLLKLGDVLMDILWEDSAVLLDNKDLLIGDLHIGLEEKMRKSGYRLIRMHRKLLAKALNLIDRTDARRLIILGDLKDSIGNPTDNELYQIDEFISELPVPLVVVLGNHDGGLRNFLEQKGVQVYSSSGFLDSGYFLFHGNARPGDRASEAEMLIACHWHPVVRIKDKTIYVERAWIKAPTVYGPPLLMMPAFNDILGGATPDEINEPYLDIEKAEVYTYDGTFLGLWEQIKNKFK